MVVIHNNSFIQKEKDKPCSNTFERGYLCFLLCKRGILISFVLLDKMSTHIKKTTTTTKQNKTVITNFLHYKDCFTIILFGDRDF